MDHTPYIIGIIGTGRIVLLRLFRNHQIGILTDGRFNHGTFLIRCDLTLQQFTPFFQFPSRRIVIVPTANDHRFRCIRLFIQKGQLLFQSVHLLIDQLHPIITLSIRFTEEHKGLVPCDEFERIFNAVAVGDGLCPGQWRRLKGNPASHVEFHFGIFKHFSFFAFLFGTHW